MLLSNTLRGALCLALLATPVAARTFDVKATGYGTMTADTHSVTDQLAVVHATTAYEGFRGEDPDNPMAGLTGPCFGSILIDEGSVSGGGHCHYTDPDGDSVILKWSANAMKEGRTQGTWAITGGSGKWSGATGKGTFDAGTDASGDYTNNVTGEVTMR